MSWTWLENVVFLWGVAIGLFLVGWHRWCRGTTVDVEEMRARNLDLMRSAWREN
jgi:hypothetical protein